MKSGQKYYKSLLKKHDKMKTKKTKKIYQKKKRGK